MILQPLLFPVMEWNYNKFTLYLTNGRDRVVWYFGKEHSCCNKFDVRIYSNKRQNILAYATVYKDLGIDYLPATFTLDELIQAINNPNYCYVPYYKEPGYLEKINKYEKRRKMMISFFKKCKKQNKSTAYKHCKYTNEIIKYDGRIITLLSCKKAGERK